MDRNSKTGAKDHCKNYFIIAGNYPALRMRISI
jgi:hypothetical protein